MVHLAGAKKSLDSEFAAVPYSTHPPSASIKEPACGSAQRVGARRREQGRHLTVSRSVAVRGGTLLGRGKMANGRVPVDPV